MNPPRRKKLPSDPREWLTHARSDLRLAKLGVTADVLPEQVCFHAQQAVEKAFKAVLLHTATDFPLTHDLEELLDLLARAGIAVPKELVEAGDLTPYAVESRYPGFWGDITEPDMREALSVAETAVIWAGERLQQTSP